MALIDMSVAKFEGNVNIFVNKPKSPRLGLQHPKSIARNKHFRLRIKLFVHSKTKITN